MKHLPPPPLDKSRCAHPVKVGIVDTLNKRIMHARRSRRGMPDNVCGNRATFTHDGMALCRQHAGHVALLLVLDDPASHEADT